MKNVFFFFIFVCLLLSANTVKAQTIVDVYKDGYIDDFTRLSDVPPDGIPDRTSDTNSLLASRGVFTNFNVDSRAIMTFDISPYAKQSLTSAFLTGYGTRVDHGGSLDLISGQFYIYSGDGLVGLDDFNSSANYLGNINFQADPTGFNLSPFQLDITSSLQQLLNNSHHFAEFRVQSNSPTVFINAGEVDPSSYFQVDTRWPGPQLALNLGSPVVTPEPTSLALFGVGSAFMGIFLRKRKS